MNFNSTLYTSSQLFTMNRNKFDFSDEQLIVCFYNYAYYVREIAMVRLIEYCRYLKQQPNIFMSLRILIDLLIVIK